MENTPPPFHEEKKDVVDEYLKGYQKLELDTAESRVKKARNAIFAIAVVFLLSELISMAILGNFTMEAILITAGISAVFVGLGFLCNKQPLTAILIALVLFVAIWIFAIVVTGLDQIYRGIVVRVIIIYFLITGIKHAREAERLRRQMHNT